MLRNTKGSFVLAIGSVSHRVEGFLWPGIVPIDGTAVDDGWELSTSVSELLSDWREGKNNMQVLSAN